MHGHDHRRLRRSGGIAAGLAALAIAAAIGIGACSPTAPSSAPTTVGPTDQPTAPVSIEASPPGASIVPSASPCFAFDPESIVGYYMTLGYICTDPRPSGLAAGYTYRSCQLVDPEGRTRTIGIVTDAADNVADAFVSVRGADGETVLDPAAVLEPFAAFLGAVLGEGYGSEMLPWLAGHLGDAEATTTLGELTLATYTDSPGDHSKLTLEIANQAYLDAPGPSGSPGAVPS